MGLFKVFFDKNLGWGDKVNISIFKKKIKAKDLDFKI